MKTLLCLRLLPLILATIVLCGLLVGGAVALAPLLRPPPPLLDGFALCGVMPCWNDIIPGETPAATARAWLRDQGYPDSDSRGGYLQRPGGCALRLTVRAGVVDGLTLRDCPGQFGDLRAYLRHLDADSQRLRYHLAAAFRDRCEALTAFTPLDSLSLGTPGSVAQSVPFSNSRRACQVMWTG